ncbi:hypothetical protein CDL15_Pgr016614 [Punica granatum]|uniref:Pyruvate carboxyltransferase domain-containing protein n=1 Tax=Punica granatum TaxID=22663 RepID=A0A218XU16_PUNGR|nr:hypothetical protein CDL15_Pgr016614 [Punica granatum]
METVLQTTSHLHAPRTVCGQIHPICLIGPNLRQLVIQSTRSPAAIRCCSLSSRAQTEYVPNHIPDPNYIRVLDTTLRDGEQAAGATMTSNQKLEIARQLARLRVDIIEAGYPAASEEDSKIVQRIAREVGNGNYGPRRDSEEDDGYVPVICALARCTENDVRVAWEAVRHARRRRIHVFIGSSKIHMKEKLRKSETDVIEIAGKMIRFARSLGCEDIEFSPEDSGRSNKELLYKILGEAIKAGATTVNIPDTVGGSLHRGFRKLIRDIRTNTDGTENVIISIHCHNDRGLALANTLEGVYEGARQVEVTVNGIGERAGNAALEEFVMVLRGPGEHPQDIYTGINQLQIDTASKMVEEYSGLYLQPHKPIVGSNAYSHASGIHQDGMLKNKGTYEIFSPEEIGRQRSNQAGIELGRLSGSAGLKSVVNKMGFNLDDEQFENVFKSFKEIAKQKKKITELDVRTLVLDEIFKSAEIWKLRDVEVSCGAPGNSMASLKLIDADGIEHTACCTGTGPVDAAYKAVDLIIRVPVKLLEYSMTAVTEGIDAIATTRVLICPGCDETLDSADSKLKFSATGASVDIVESSVKAYVAALNRMLGLMKKIPSLGSSS